MARPFVFVLHHHQPPGNLPEVMDRALTHCYLPILDALEAHPDVAVTLHYSGALLEWLKTNAPEVIERIAALAKSERAELLGGAFYEPVLTQIPEADAAGQLAMMQMFQERYLGVRTRGVWLAERVWEPELPRILFNQKVAYTFVDDRHFYEAGVPRERVGGHFVTERAGAPVGLFPIHRRLRYAIPFNAPQDVVQTISQMPHEGAVVYADDAEKLGLWPDTYRWVFEERWLERFFEALTAAREQVKTVLPSRLLETTPSNGRVYLAQGAYEEMMAWTLPRDAARAAERAALRLDELELSEVAVPRMQGRSFASFLAKYPAADRLHKKMLRVSDRLQSEMEVAIDASESGKLTGEVGDLLGTAQRSLYRGQTACVYWHGLFGGLYTGHLRRAAHASLLDAERILDELQQGEDDFVAYEEEDVDLDGREEVVLESRHLGVVVRPHAGGHVVAFDDRRNGVAVADVVARHREAYHDDGVVEDRTPRAMFVDRVLPSAPTEAQLEDPDAFDLAALAASDYRIESLGVVGEDDDGAPAAELVLVTETPQVALAIEKRVSLEMERARLSVAYRVKNTGDSRLEGAFVVELATSFVGDADAPVRERTIDEGAGIDLVFEGEADREHVFALTTTTRREDGLHRTLLGRVAMRAFDLDLAPGAERAFVVAVATRPAR